MPNARRLLVVMALVAGVSVGGTPAAQAEDSYVILPVFQAGGIYSPGPAVPPAVQQSNLTLFGDAVGVAVVRGQQATVAHFRVSGSGQETGNLALANGSATVHLATDIFSVVPGSGTCDLGWLRVGAAIVMQFRCELDVGGVDGVVCGVATADGWAITSPTQLFKVVGSAFGVIPCS
jgi:hypothetical protein